MIRISRQYLTVEEVAEYLGLSVSAIRKWVRLELIPYNKFNGSIRFDFERIKKWARENVHESQPMN